MEQNQGEYIAITYMFLNKGKWKTKTEIIESKDVDRFLVYRLLSTMSMEEYYKMMERTA